MAHQYAERSGRRIRRGRPLIRIQVQTADLVGRKSRHQRAGLRECCKPALLEDPEIERLPERQPVEIALRVCRMPRRVLQQEFRGEAGILAACRPRQRPER